MEEVFEYRASKPMKPEDIEGMDKIKAAYAASHRYHRAKMAFERGELDFEDVPRHKPGEIQELEQKYPRAAAYRKAEQWTRSGEPIKVRLGKQACVRLLNGEDCNTVLEDMRRELDAFNLAQQEG